jgi:hypothetical protein
MSSGPSAATRSRPTLQRACEWAACGDAVFEAAALPELAGGARVAGFEDGEVRTGSLERWSLPTQFGVHYGAELERSEALTVVTHLTCTEVVPVEGADAVGRAPRALVHGARGAPDRRRAAHGGPPDPGRCRGTSATPTASTCAGRFTFAPEAQAAEGLPNVAMWPVNPPIADPAHREGFLSLVYLALRTRLGSRLRGGVHP